MGSKGSQIDGKKIKQDNFRYLLDRMILSKIFKYYRWLIPPEVKKFIANLRYKVFNIFSIVVIETSSGCNRRCSYCPNSKFDRGLMKNDKKMEKELFYKIIDELFELKWFGQMQFHLYNEPLLDERLPDLVKYSRLKLPNSSIVIYTNGDYLTIDLYNKLVESGVTGFVITEHTNRKPDAIEKLLEYRKSITRSQVSVISRKLERFDSRGGLIELSVRAKESKYCLWGTHSFIVNYEGEAVLCCEDYFNTVKLGNVAHERLMDIWNKPNYKELRNELKARIFKLAICKKCGLGKLD